MTASPMEMDESGPEHGSFDREEFSSACGFLSGCSGRVELAPNFAGVCTARPTAAEFLRLFKSAVSQPTLAWEKTLLPTTSLTSLTATSLTLPGQVTSRWA
jgi:hypothetical protein